ncbi:MBL fold metallo-hydrolase [bacterium]|jgi:ribonuclease BN (tRNA processing enzyme)|nr:MBL fold metallo-hydrolase [bacterium]
MNAMNITFYGVRGTIPYSFPKAIKFGSNTACVHCETKNEHIILDAGSGIYPLGKKINDDKPIYIFLSHFHWDHILGLNLFDPFFQEGKQIFIVSPNKRRMQNYFKTFFDGVRFPVPLSAVASPPKFLSFDQVKLRGFKIDTFENQHPEPTYSIRIKHISSKKSFCYCTDNELGVLKKNSSSYLKFIKFCENADLGVFDAQYTDEEYKTKGGWGHSSVSDVLNLSKEASVKHTLFFHHDPLRPDHEMSQIVTQIQEWGKDHFPEAIYDCARERTSFSL